MTVITGDQGLLRIQRSALGDGALSSVLDPSDVNAERRRFSFDFPANSLITGDRVEIATLDGSLLELVAGHPYPDGVWYIHIDDVGGVRLYADFDASINGGYAEALPLVTPTRSTEIVVRTRDLRYNCISQMQTWELTTSRQAVDTTVLGDEFVSMYARGLVSGQGQLTCLWDFRREPCSRDDAQAEEPHYLCQLLLRLRQGAKFDAQFFAFFGEKSVWYEATCVVTNVGLSFEPGRPVISRVEYVTTGPVSLHVGQLDAFLLQESGDLLVLETQDGALLLEEPLD